jgi:hypothetical protein
VEESWGFIVLEDCTRVPESLINRSRIIYQRERAEEGWGDWLGGLGNPIVMVPAPQAYFGGRGGTGQGGHRQPDEEIFQ